MGYDVYITRASEWLDREAHPIMESEWKALVESDPSMQVSQEDYYDRASRSGKIERIHPVLWQEHPDRVAFWYIAGTIEVKSPDEPTIKKMVQIAQKLNARVIGDDGEEYQ